MSTLLPGSELGPGGGEVGMQLSHGDGMRLGWNAQPSGESSRQSPPAAYPPSRMQSKAPALL